MSCNKILKFTNNLSRASSFSSLVSTVVQLGLKEQMKLWKGLTDRASEGNIVVLFIFSVLSFSFSSNFDIWFLKLVITLLSFSPIQSSDTNFSFASWNLVRCGAIVTCSWASSYLGVFTSMQLCTCYGFSCSLLLCLYLMFSTQLNKLFEKLPWITENAIAIAPRKCLEGWGEGDEQIVIRKRLYSPSF